MTIAEESVVIVNRNQRIQDGASGMCTPCQLAPLVLIGLLALPTTLFAESSSETSSGSAGSGAGSDWDMIGGDPFLETGPCVSERFESWPC